MGRLNYKRLNPTEFEILAKGVCEKMLKRKLERFGEGADDGIDLTDDVLRPTIIVQCKRYENSSQAVQVFKEEAGKMEAFKDSLKEYYAFTSASLSPSQVGTIRNLFSDYMDSDDHVIFNETIEDFFNERSNIDVLEKNLRLFVSLPEWYDRKDIFDKHIIELEVGVTDGQICLSDNAVNKLKEYYHSYEDLKKKELQVNLAFPDFNKIAETIIREDIVRDCGKEQAFEVARRDMSRRIRGVRPVFERAVKYILQYSGKFGLAQQYDLFYIENYGEENALYEDEFGVKNVYSDVYFWITIANRIISDHLTGRLSTLGGLDTGYCSISLHRKFRKKPFELTTYAPDKCKEIRELKFGDAYVSEFDQEAQLFYIYPEIFFRVAQFVIRKEDDEPLSPAEIVSLLNPYTYFVSLG